MSASFLMSDRSSSAFDGSAWKRSHFCGRLRAGEGAVTLNGWVRGLREHKGALFADLWDDSGVIQLVFPASAELASAAGAFSESSAAAAAAGAADSGARPASSTNSASSASEAPGAPPGPPSGAPQGNISSRSAPQGSAPEGFFGKGERKIHFGDVIAVKAHVRERPEGMKNSRLPTGGIEAEVKELSILSPSQTPPFHAGAKINEEMGLKYRYLDLRFRDDLRKNLKTRSQALKITRDFFLKQNFYEIETPVLYKSSPEGARDYIVPSRLQKGLFYALPQSPQILKQLLMTAGMERYFQICRCFRDEDLRADRQPEFSQIDMEMSFADEEDVQRTAEGLIKQLWGEILGEDIKSFPSLSYEEAVRDFGSDKPDIRNPLRLKALSRELFSQCFPRLPLSAAARNNAEERGAEERGLAKSGSKALGATGDGSGGGKAPHRGGPNLGGPQRGEPASGEPANNSPALDRQTAKALFVPQLRLSNSRLKKLNEEAKKAGARGLLWISADEAGKCASPSKAEAARLQELVLESGGGKERGLCLIGFGEESAVNRFMSSLISRFGKEMGLIKPGFAFLWITGFPFWEWDAQKKGWSARHHPFTSPDREGIERLMAAGALSGLRSAGRRAAKAGAEAPRSHELGAAGRRAAELRPAGLDAAKTGSGARASSEEPAFSDQASIKARAYDLVCNGHELAGGSVRNHSAALQKKIFSLAGLSDGEIERKFGFFLKALSLGAPPHAGIAFGLDRLLMLLAGTENIRDVTAFPKSASGSCLMSGAPSPADPALLKDLGLPPAKEL